MNTGNNGIERAMDSVNLRVNEFEHSLDNIITKFENVSATFQRLIGIGSRQTQRIAAVKNATVDTVAPFFRGGRRLSSRVVTQVRQNPRTVLVGAALIVGGLWLITRARTGAGEIVHAESPDLESLPPVEGARDERFMH